jgi:uncharacterized membrane protein
MPSLTEVAVLAAMLGSGLVAGLCFAFASFIMRSFDRLGTRQAVRAMQAINAGILRSTAMPIWFGTALLGLLVAVTATEQPIAIAAATLYAIGAILITGLGNVPLNEALDLVDPDAPGAEAAWRHYRVYWGRWNALRTVVCALAAVGFALVA